MWSLFLAVGFRHCHQNLSRAFVEGPPVRDQHVIQHEHIPLAAKEIGPPRLDTLDVFHLRWMSQSAYRLRNKHCAEDPLQKPPPRARHARAAPDSKHERDEPDRTRP